MEDLEEEEHNVPLKRTTPRAMQVATRGTATRGTATRGTVRHSGASTAGSNNFASKSARATVSLRQPSLTNNNNNNNSTLVPSRAANRLPPSKASQSSKSVAFTAPSFANTKRRRLDDSSSLNCGPLSRSPLPSFKSRSASTTTTHSPFSLYSSDDYSNSEQEEHPYYSDDYDNYDDDYDDNFVEPDEEPLLQEVEDAFSQDEEDYEERIEGNQEEFANDDPPLFSTTDLHTLVGGQPAATTVNEQQPPRKKTDKRPYP